MKFGPVPVAEAVGALLAHSIKTGNIRLKKGLELRSQQIDQLRAAGIEEVIVARLDPGDLHEDAAAGRLAAALVPEPEAVGLRLTAPFTGRVNVLADGAGVACLDVAALEAVNRVDPMITVATVPDCQQMAAGGMVATVKVISFGVSEQQVTRACESARGALRLARPVYQDRHSDHHRGARGPGEDKARKVIGDRLKALEIQMVECVIVRIAGPIWWRRCRRRRGSWCWC